MPENFSVELNGHKLGKESIVEKDIKILYKKDLAKHLNYVFDTYNVTEQTLFTLFDAKS